MRYTTWFQKKKLVCHISLKALLALKLPGYYQGAASKWNKSRQAYHWDLVLSKCPHIAAKYDEVPNWLRARLNIDSTKGPQHGRIPEEVLDVVDTILKRATVDGFELNSLAIQLVLKDAIEAFNLEVVAWRAARAEADIKALDDLTKAGATEEELVNLQRKQERGPKHIWPHSRW